MQTDTLNIPNSDGLTYRLAVNEALKANATDHAGTTAPVETWPHMSWLDTSATPATLKRRNDANDAWEIPAVIADDIAERTAGHGVEIDGVLLKDGLVAGKNPANIVDPNTLTDATLNGSERVAIKQAGSWFRTTLSNIAAFVTGIYTVTVHTGVGAVARTLLAVVRDQPVSILNFIPVAEHAAIKAGTSTYDCAGSLASALSIGSVLVPDGTYMFSAAAAVPSNRTISGQGYAVFKVRSGAVHAPCVLNIVNSTNVTVEKITFDGNTSEITPFNNVVQTFNSHDVLVERCRFLNCRGIALLVSQGSNVGVKDSVFEDCGTHHLISGNPADRKQAFATTGCVGAYAENNTFRRIGLDCISMATASHNGRAVGNKIYTNYSGSIYFANSSGMVAAQNIVNNGASGGNAIDVFSCTDVTVHSNICFGNGAAGILFANVTNGSATGNVCYNNWQSGTSTHRGGITLSATAPSATRSITLSGNICYDDQGVGSVTQQYAIGITTTGGGTYSNICIDGTNLLTGYTSGGSEDPADIFQNSGLGLVGYPLTLNLSAGAEFVLYSSTTFGRFSIICTNNGATGDFVSRKNLGALRLSETPAGAYQTTDTGAEQSVYFDSTTNTVRLKNRSAATRTYVVIPLSERVGS